MWRLWRTFRLLGREGGLLLKALLHPETPIGVKLGTLFLVVYILSPIDLIPDAVPILGWTDDALISYFMMPWLIKKIPLHVIEALQAKRAKTVSG